MSDERPKLGQDSRRTSQFKGRELVQFRLLVLGKVGGNHRNRAKQLSICRRAASATKVIREDIAPLGFNADRYSVRRVSDLDGVIGDEYRPGNFMLNRDGNSPYATCAQRTRWRIRLMCRALTLNRLAST